MTKKEQKQIQKEVSQQTLDIYAGILFNNQRFEDGNDEDVIYNFDCPEFKTIKDKYNLEEIAGKGTDFKKAKRLLHYLAPKLTHLPWYDNHISCNSLDLLEYSLNNPDHGINCVNKAKIMEECCLALGIYARRVFLIPYSPFDFDNHVVTEIYDRKFKKWIMLDPSTDGLFVDENKTPLSVLEIREKFANDEFVTFTLSTDSLKDLNKLKDKHLGQNVYFCKNLFYFFLNKYSTFGVSDGFLVFVPVNFSIKEKLIANTKYRIKHLPLEHIEMKKELENLLEQQKQSEEGSRNNINSMIKSPL